MILRIRIITGCIFLLVLILIGRLYQVQVLAHERYTELAERQYVYTKQDLYSRGSIYFTTKEGEKVSAASIRSGYVLAFNPTLITDATRVCEAVLPYISISSENVSNERHSVNEPMLK